MSTYEPTNIDASKDNYEEQIIGLPDAKQLAEMEKRIAEQNTKLDKMSEEQPKITESTVIPKYSLVPRFWSSPTELECIDIVSTFNKVTGIYYVKFIDIEGRLGAIREDEVGIHFLNNPTKEDIEDFQRLKKESNTLSKIIDKPKENDQSVA